MMGKRAYEVNFDGIVGPTHNYSGLSYGNVASQFHKQSVSNPKAAALQGLEKMHHLSQMGLKQAVLPPQERPHLPTLRALGYQGSDSEILKQTPVEILTACTSAAAMWTANAATMAPSADTIDKKLHLTPANLACMFHRALEASTTSFLLQKIFPDPSLFTHHAPLPYGTYLSDEGAANHTRFCSEYGARGIHLFVYGKSAFNDNALLPRKYPARQTLEASQTIARLHQLQPEQTLFAQQNPHAIDSGVFHNDVISVGNQNFFLYHEKAFIDTPAVIAEIQKRARLVGGFEMRFLEVKESRIPLSDAVKTYLFNSQIVTLPDDTVALIAPTECRENIAVLEFLEDMINSPDNPVSQVHHFNLKQSMQNGGGPACLRLRIVLTEAELAACHPDVFLTDKLYQTLKGWIERHYRDRLLPEDLSDPELMKENQHALDELTQILKLGAVYSFQ